MLLEVILIIVLGIIAGGIVNLLADELPYRRRFRLPPVYADGSPRPVSAWLGITAFLTGNRAPKSITPPPDNIPVTDAEGNELSPIERIRELKGSRIRLYRQEPKLTWRYPLAEVACVVLMVLAYAVSIEKSIPPLQTIFWLIYMPIFVLITVIDLEHKLILFDVTIPTMILALLNAAIVPDPPPNLIGALAGGIFGFLVFFIFYQGGFLFVKFLNRNETDENKKINTVAFGYGDVMMITITGLMLGFSYTFIAIFVTIFLGAIGAVGYIILRSALGSSYSMFTAIPYGPYIVAATIIMLLYGEQTRLLLFGW